jgi:hypothetical protein
LRFEVCKTLIQIEAAEVNKAIPILIDALHADNIEDLEDEDAAKEREKARDLLVSLGKPAVGPLVSALENQFAPGRPGTPTANLNAGTRLEVIKVLVGIGTPASRTDVLLALTEVQKNDPFAGVRKAAREARIKLQNKKE